MLLLQLMQRWKSSFVTLKIFLDTLKQTWLPLHERKLHISEWILFPSIVKDLTTWHILQRILGSVISTVANEVEPEPAESAFSSEHLLIASKASLGCRFWWGMSIIQHQWISARSIRCNKTHDQQSVYCTNMSQENHQTSDNMENSAFAWKQ